MKTVVKTKAKKTKNQASFGGSILKALRFSSSPCALLLRSTSSSVELIPPINEAIVLIYISLRPAQAFRSRGLTRFGRLTASGS
jgi:hypothetical protein